MNEKEKSINDILVNIAREISITESMLDKAKSSYEAVGKWIGEGLPYQVRIMPQGSMNLGTTIKPVSEEDDYDIDLVCLLEDGQKLCASQIKHIVGNRLKAHGVYGTKVLEEGEGKRCWKMQYDEFHMDILPCVPKIEYIEPTVTDIRLTHKSENAYEDRFSNPYGYHIWFEKQMGDVLYDEKYRFAVMNKTEIENVPNYKVKTPLQMAIQLLKRHRDVYFIDNVENAPISIIITTLAAHAYNGETNLYEAICNILNNMESYIEVRNGVYWIPNPTMPKENFADKWEIYPERASAFFGWLTKAKKEIVSNPLAATGLDHISNEYEKVFGRGPVQRAIKQLGNNMYTTRQANGLYSLGLSSGLSTVAHDNAKIVKGHTFFGE